MSADSAAPEASSTAPLAGASAGVRRAIVVFAGVTMAAGLASTALLPYLLVEHPILLLILSADGRNIMLTAPQLDIVTMLTVGTPRRALGMLATYWVGALYGRAMLGWTERRLPMFAPLLRFLERLFLRFGTPLLVLFPTYTLAGMAGITRVRLRAFVIPMTAGQVVYVASAYYLGESVSAWTDQLVAFVSAHLWESTAICVALVLVQQLVARKRRQSGVREDARANDAQTSEAETNDADL